MFRLPPSNPRLDYASCDHVTAPKDNITNKVKEEIPFWRVEVP